MSSGSVPPVIMSQTDGVPTGGRGFSRSWGRMVSWTAGVVSGMAGGSLDARVVAGVSLVAIWAVVRKVIRRAWLRPSGDLEP